MGKKYGIYLVITYWHQPIDSRKRKGKFVLLEDVNAAGNFMGMWKLHALYNESLT